MSNALAIAPNHVALIYARVSEGAGSIKDQIRELTQWANDEGWSIGRTIVDPDRSASTRAKKEREGFIELLAAIREPNRPETILLTWEPSRLSRISEQIHELTTIMARHNLLWGYDETIHDMRKTRDKAKVRHDGVDSEKESDEISDRVSRHHRNAAVDGKPHGRIPFGYQRAYDVKGNMSQVPDPATAPIVREAAQRFLSGESTRSIAKDFERQGFPTPSESQSSKERSENPLISSHGWQAYMIRRMLTNPAINGKRQHQGKIVSDGNWTAIIDDITFARLQARFADPSRKTIRQRESVRLLTGVARCGVCDGPMGFAVKRSDGIERGIYSCRYGNHVSRYQAPLEDWVVGALIKYMRANDVGNDDPAPELMAARERIEELNGKLNGLTELFKSGDLDPQGYAEGRRVLLDSIRETERSIKVANIPTAAIEMADADDPETYWRKLSKTDVGVEKQREILRATFIVKVHPVTNHGSHKFETETIEIIAR